MLVVDSSGKVSKRAASGLTVGSATLASTVTVTDISSDVNAPIVFHNESNALFDDTGALFYNPSTGTLTTPNLTVSGTTTTINTTNLNVEDKNITLNYNASSDTSSTADGAGITIQDAVDASNDASLTWTAADDTFEFSHAVEINNGASGGTAALLIDNDDVDQIALDIDAANTTANIIDINAQALTTANVINIDSNNLEVGGSLIKADWDLTGDGHGHHLQGIYLDIDKSGGIGSSQTNNIYGLRTAFNDNGTNAGSSQFYGTHTTIVDDNASGFNNRYGHWVKITGGDASTSYGLQTQIENGGFDLKCMSSATIDDYFTLAVGANGATTLSTVDTTTGAVGHFEIEADGNIILDSAGTTDIESVGLIKTTGAGVEIENGSSTGASALLIDNDDVDQIALNIDAENTTANIVDINAQALTTGKALFIDSNSLSGTNSLINIDIDSAYTTGEYDIALLDIDYDKSGATASGQTSTVTGIKLNIDDGGTTAGTTNLTGLDVFLDATNNGTANLIGLNIDTANTTRSIGSTAIGLQIEAPGASILGPHIKLLSYQDTGDYCQIYTTTHGATWIQTTDDDAAAGHINFNPDGEVRFFGSASKWFNSALNTSDYLSIEVGTDGNTTLTTVDAAATNAHFEIAADGNITLDAAGTIELEAATNLTGALTVGVDDTGHDVKFFGATSGKHLLWDESDDQLEFTDNTYAVFGDGDDLKIYHSSTASLVANYTGNLQIDNHATDKDILFRTDNGNAGIFTYFYLDGSSATVDGGGSTTAVYTIFPDTSRLAFGSVKDMQIWHDATDSQIQNNTGDLYIQSNVTDGDIILRCDDGSGGTTAYITLDGSAANTVVHTDFLIASQKKLQDSSNSNKYIELSDSSANIVYSAYAKHVWRTYNGSSYGDRMSITNTGELEAPRRKFAKTSNTDGDHDGDVVYFGGTTSMTTGALYHYKSDGTWELADADAASTCDGLLGVALGAASDTNGVLLRGMVTLDHDPGAVGDVLYVSTTAGDTTATAPSGSGDIVRVVGYCIDASNGQIWFNPDGTFVEIS